MTNLNGLWTFSGPSCVLAYDAANAAPHGTFTGVPFFRIVMFNDNTEFRIFDETGEFAHFALNAATGRWTWRRENWIYDIPPGNSDLAPNGAWGNRFPMLVLTKYNNTDFPRPRGSTAKWCPRSQRGNIDFYRLGHPPQPTDWVEVAATPDDGRYTKEFYWRTDEHEDGLMFSYVQVPDKKRIPGEREDTFGKVFVGQSDHSQLSALYCGFDIRKLNLYAQVGPGTTWRYYPGNDRQGIGGRLLFEYPTRDSMNYWQQQDVRHQPYLPLGLRLVELPLQFSRTHSEMVSSAADHLKSYSTAFGLSGGIDKMLGAGINVTCTTQLEEQQKSERRYTISRTIHSDYAYIAEVPSMTLHPDFVGEIKRRLAERLVHPTRGKAKWENFINDFGMHYAAAMVMGRIEMARTEFSLKSEGHALAKKIDLKTTSSATLDSVKVKNSAELSKEWKDKYNLEISKEDIEDFAIGDPGNPVGILFDLRPIYQLLNPIYFSYSNIAPFIWYNLRDDLKSYLDTMGSGSPLDLSLMVESVEPPRLVKVSVPSIHVDSQAEGVWAIVEAGLDASGRVSFEEHPSNCILSQSNYEPAGDPITQQGQHLGFDRLGALIAVRKGQPVKFKLNVDLSLGNGIFTFARYNFSLPVERSMTQKAEMVELPVAEAADERIDGRRFYLHYSVLWEELDT